MSTAAAPQTGPAPKRKLSPRMRWMRDTFLFVALRWWAFVLECFPIEVNLQTARWLGRIWWHISPKHRERALTNLRASFGDQYTPAQLERIARESFEHWTQVFLVELIQSPRVLHRFSWPQFVELGDIGPALRCMLQGRSVLMLTPHFGNFELLGFALCRLGIPLVAVMRPLDDARLNQILVERRARSGLRLLDKKGAMEEAQSVIDAGTPLCFIADQDAGPKGYFVEFFGRPASTYKSIALLAVQNELPVIVGYAARSRAGFHYRIGVERIIDPDEWRERVDAPFWITQEFSRAMEGCIRRCPEQYLWVHRRWKTQPKKRSAHPQDART